MNPQMQPQQFDTDNLMPGQLQAKPVFPSFIRDFFFDYRAVLKNHLTAEKPPFLFIFVWLLGMSSVIDRIELKALQNQTYPLGNWPAIWGLILIGGIVSGYVGYYVGGAFYHFRVWLSGGSKNRHISRNLFLYTGLPVYAAAIISEIVDTIVYGDKYFTGETNPSLGLTWLFVSVVAILYSISLSYRGVRLLQETKLVRSIIMFIALPVLFYTLVFGLAFAAQALRSDAVDYNEKALAFMSEGNYTEAERHFNLAIEELDSSDRRNAVTIYGNLGFMHECTGNTEKAIESYQKVMSLCEPGDSLYHSMSGNINLMRNNIEEAVRDFENALKSDPNDFDAHNNLGLIFLGEFDEDWTDYEKALAHNEKGYSLNKGYSTTKNLALNYYLLGRYSEALPLFEAVETISPQDAAAKYFIGLIYYYQENDPAKGREYLQEAISLDPSLNSPDIEQILHGQDSLS